MSSNPIDPQNMRAFTPFVRLLDIEPIEASPGRAVIELTVADKHTRSHGMAHGGLTATVLDTVMGFAARTLAPEGQDTVTLQLNVNYLRPAMLGEKLIATGTARHGGRRTAVIQGEIVNESNALIALASATMMFIPKPTT